MPIIRKIVPIGGSKGITLPASWFEWIKRENGVDINEVLIEVDKVLIISPIIPKKEGVH
jgi:antitoxin component of MazEF toxin-antitoxin module